jgi:hypothetical protein
MIVSSLLMLLGLAEAKQIDFYVAPIEIHNRTRHKEIEQAIDNQLAFAISSGYSRTFEVTTDRGIFVPAPMEFESIRIFNDRTIGYFYDCEYEKDPIKCAIQNKHYFVETIVTVDDNQLTVRMTMYGPDLQVVNSSISHEEMQVNWIKQQEVTNIQTTQRDGTKTNLTHHGLERHPLKWEIPHHLLEKHIREAASELWLGAKIRL